MDELTRRRLEHNEQLFREVNVARERSQPGPAPVAFVCECADRACTEEIELTVDEYEAIRREERRYVIHPGHEIAELERVVERHDGYEVVEKSAA